MRDGSLAAEDARNQIAEAWGRYQILIIRSFVLTGAFCSVTIFIIAIFP